MSIRRMVSLRQIISFCLIGIIISLLIFYYFLAKWISESNRLLSIQGSLSSNSHLLCVLVPFRDRFEALFELIPHLSTFLQNQEIDHLIYVLQQVDGYRFNKGSLFNAGFKLSFNATRRRQCDYFALHDVDLLPLNDQISYSYPPKGVVHLSPSELHPKYDYQTFMGGIILIRREIFQKVNGFSNNYWGWGLEDDEFNARLQDSKISIQVPANIATGKANTFRHIHSDESKPRDIAICHNQLEVTQKRDLKTGLHNVHFSVQKKFNLTLDGHTATFFNIAIECDVTRTPWCTCPNTTEFNQLNKVVKFDSEDIIVPNI